MSTNQRITLSIPTDVLAKVRELSDGNISQFVTTAIKTYLDQERRRKLREELIIAAIEKAEEDLEMVEAFKYVDYETTMKYIPPSPELEIEDAAELAEAR